MNSAPVNQSFQWFTKANRPTVASEGVSTGSRIDHRIRKLPAPSMDAASSISLGRERMKFIRMAMLETGTASGSTSAQMLFSRCRLLIRMYQGTRPPPKSIVNT